jgi:hypothetical protein
MQQSNFAYASIFLIKGKPRHTAYPTPEGHGNSALHFRYPTNVPKQTLLQDEENQRLKEIAHHGLPTKQVFA